MAFPGGHGAQDPAGSGAQRRQKDATPPSTLVTLTEYSLATSLVYRRPWHREHLSPSPTRAPQHLQPPGGVCHPLSLTASW